MQSQNIFLTDSSGKCDPGQNTSHHHVVLTMTSAAAEEKKRNIVQAYGGENIILVNICVLLCKILKTSVTYQPLSSISNWTEIEMWQLFCKHEEEFFSGANWT
jgi:hypothetical protein